MPAKQTAKCKTQLCRRTLHAHASKQEGYCAFCAPKQKKIKRHFDKQKIKNHILNVIKKQNNYLSCYKINELLRDQEIFVSSKTVYRYCVKLEKDVPGFNRFSVGSRFVYGFGAFNQ